MSQLKYRPVVVIVVLLLSLTVGAAWTITSRPKDIEIDPLLEPQIIGQSPRFGEEMPFDGAIDIYFNHPMNPASVRLALSTRPYFRHEQVWLDSKTLRLTPAEGVLRPDTTYTITLNKIGRTQAGYSFSEPASIEVHTIGELLVQEVTPSDGTKNLDPESTIAVVFNRPVAPLTVAEGITDLPDPIEFKPDLPGEGEWVNTNIYVWHPTEPMASGQDYQATISKGFEGLFGAPLRRAYTWEFSTALPTIEAVYLDDHRLNDDRGSHALLESRIKIEFSQSMDRESTEAAFSLTDTVTRRKVSGTFSWQDNNRLLIFTPGNTLDMDTTYQIEVASKAYGAQGGKPLGRLRKFTFSTVPYPSVFMTWPRNNEKDAYVYSSRAVEVEFNTLMDGDSLRAEGAVVIEPELVGDVSISTYRSWMSLNSTSLTVYGILELETTYTVTISEDVTDIYGNPLGEPYTFFFTTRGYGKHLQINNREAFGFYDASQPTRVAITTRNIENVNLELRQLGDRGTTPWNPTALNQSGEEIRTWTVAPGGAHNEAVVRAVNMASQGGPLEPGVYKLIAHTGSSDTRQYKHTLVVGNANLTLKVSFNEALAWLTDLQTGEPIPGKQVRIYGYTGSDTPYEELGSAVTDEQGIAEFPITQQASLPYSYSSGYYYWWSGPQDQLVAVVDEGSTFALAITDLLGTPSTGGFGVSYQRANIDQSLYLFTDRPLYRPGQEVFFQGVLRDKDDITYTVPQNEEVRVRVISQYDERTIYSETLEVDETGCFEGSFTLSEGVVLDRYYFDVETSGRLYESDYYWYWADRPNTYFDVADYRKPELQVNVIADQAEVMDGQTIEATVEGCYFFGEPLRNADVMWNTWAVPYTFDYTGPGYYRFTDSTSYWYRISTSDEPDYVATDMGQTDENGQLRISFPANIRSGYQSQRYIVEATAEEITGRVDVVVHQSEYYIGIRADRYAGAAGEPMTYSLIVVDVNSQPVPDQTITVQPIKQAWHWERYIINQYGYPEYRWRWVVDETEIGEPIVATTDQEGHATVSFTPGQAGSYRIRASVSDSEGREHTASTFSWVRRPGYTSWRSGANSSRIDVIADQEHYQPGDMAELLITSPYESETLALVTVERGSILSHEVVTVDEGSYLYTLPITADHAPNIYVSVILIKGVDEDTPFPDFRMGLTELKVDAVEQELNITITPDRERILPGEDVTYRIEVTDHEGTAVQNANVSLSLVDLALLTLTEPNVDPAIDHFYADQPLSVITAVPLAELVDRLLVELIPEPPEMGGGGGGGGGGPPMPGLGLEDLLRSEFKDTAYWTTQLRTDQNGVVEVTVTMPDNLTTWRMEARVFTADTRVGQTTTDIISTLPLLIRPQTPRFFIAEDRPVLAANIHNNTDEDMQVTAMLEASGVTFGGVQGQAVTIPARGHVQVDWPVTVDEDAEWVDLVFSAQGTTTGGEHFADAVKPEIGDPEHDRMLPVYRYDVQETVGLAGQLEEAGEEIEGLILPPTLDYTQGELEIQLDSSLANSLFGTLTWLEHYPYECNEQLASRLLPNAATLRLMRVLGIDDPELEAHLKEQIQIGIDRLDERQDRGWGWWPGDDPNPLATAYVIHALLVADGAGFEAESIINDSSYRYLRVEAENISVQDEEYELNLKAYILYVLAKSGNYDEEQVDELYEARSELYIYTKALLAQTIWLESRYDPRLKTLKAELVSEATASATGIHWEEGTQDYRNWNTDIRTNAIVLDTFALIWPDSELNPQIVRYLMVAREADHWSTTQETVWSLTALTDWMRAGGGFDAGYEWSVDLNEEQLGSGNAVQDMAGGPIILTVGLDDLPAGELNQLIFGRTAGPGSLFYTSHLSLDLPVEEVKALSRGVTVSRRYLDANGNPVTQARVGDELTVEVTVVAPNAMHYFFLEDYYPAGADAVNSDLLTESGLRPEPDFARVNALQQWGWGWWYFSHIELRDEKAVLSTDYLPAGTYQFTYQIRLGVAGEYHVIPTTAWEFYFPEVYGRGDGMLFTVLPKQ